MAKWFSPHKFLQVDFFEIYVTFCQLPSAY